MWDLSSLTRDQTHVPCVAGQILNHWTTREVPWSGFHVYLFIFGLAGSSSLQSLNRLSLVKASGGYSLAVVCGLLTAAAPHVAGRRL